MKKTIKILKSIFLLPVKPLAIIFSCYLLYLIYKNTNFVDFNMFLDKIDNNKKEDENYSIEQDLPNDLVMYIKSFMNMTRPFLYSISLGVWYWFITTFIL